MKWAPPIVSHEASFLTRQFYASIFLTENASDKVTAKGRPSGTATTTIATDKIRYFKIVPICSEESQPFGIIY
jgi:hypothetical protein